MEEEGVHVILSVQHEIVEDKSWWVENGQRML